MATRCSRFLPGKLGNGHVLRTCKISRQIDDYLWKAEEESVVPDGWEADKEASNAMLW